MATASPIPGGIVPFGPVESPGRVCDRDSRSRKALGRATATAFTITDIARPVNSHDDRGKSVIQAAQCRRRLQ